MRCRSASYATLEEADRASRKLLKELFVTSVSVRCDRCDRFHLSTQNIEKEIPDKGLIILQCLAQGYTDIETGQIVNLRARLVEGKVTDMKKRFNALSRSNLVAITIALGIIDPVACLPHSFVP